MGSTPDANQKSVVKDGTRDVIREVKSDLRAEHNHWLRHNSVDHFYASPLHGWRVDRILELVEPISGEVLDIGCFVGYLGEKLTEQGNKEVTGVDCLEAALERASERGLTTVLADIDEGVLPFEDARFDLVIAADVLNSVFDPDSAIEEIHRVLKPGGKIVITVPNLAGIGNRMLMLFGKAPHNLQERAREGVGHLRLFTFKSLERLLTDYDFKTLKRESVTFCSPFMRFGFTRIPLLRKFFPLKPEYEYGRLSFSRTLAKWFPKLSENILMVAEKPKAGE